MTAMMDLRVARAGLVLEVDNPDGTKTQMLFKLRPARAHVEAVETPIPGGGWIFEGYDLELAGHAVGFTVYHGTLLDDPAELERPRKEVTDA